MKFDAEKFEREYSPFLGQSEGPYIEKLKDEVYQALDKMYEECKKDKNKEIHVYFHDMGNNVDIPEFLHLNFHCLTQLNGQKFIIHENQYDEMEMSNEHINIVFAFTTNFYNDFNISVLNTMYSEFCYDYYDIPIVAFIIDVPFRYKSELHNEIRTNFNSWILDRKIKQYPYE